MLHRRQVTGLLAYGSRLGALGLLALPSWPMGKRQGQDLAVVQAPFDRRRDQAGQLPGAVAGRLLQLPGQMGWKPLGHCGRSHR